MELITEIYQRLIKHFGPRGWWPLSDLRELDADGGLRQRGYHPGDFSYPQNDRQIFEICLGAILTQNTTWRQVEKVLLNLVKEDLLHPGKIPVISIERLKDLIKPCGYFNQKTRKIKIFLDFFTRLEGRIPRREELLSLWGLGPETADSILLYAYKQPVFVIDAYTRRVYSRISGDTEHDYHRLQEVFSRAFLSLQSERKSKVFNEFHALLVELAKHFCAPRPRCRGCPLGHLCRFKG